MYLIDHSRKIKPSHLNRVKFRLNQKGSKVLGDLFLKKTSTVFNFSTFITEECKPNFSLKNKKRTDSKNILKSIRTEH